MRAERAGTEEHWLDLADGSGRLTHRRRTVRGVVAGPLYARESASASPISARRGTRTEKGHHVAHSRQPPPAALYRVLAALAGLYVLVFGVLGFFETRDAEFDRGSMTALGLRTNLAFSLASIVAGAVILLAFRRP